MWSHPTNNGAKGANLVKDVDAEIQEAFTYYMKAELMEDLVEPAKNLLSYDVHKYFRKMEKNMTEKEKTASRSRFKKMLTGKTISHKKQSAAINHVRNRSREINRVTVCCLCEKGQKNILSGQQGW